MRITTRHVWLKCVNLRTKTNPAAMSGYSRVMSSTPMGSVNVSSEVQQMLANLQEAERTVTVDNVDQHPDDPQDVVGNPIHAKTVMGHGKHKGKEFYKIYVEDKGYNFWARGHIGPKSTVDMQKMRIFIEYTDAKKIERLQNQYGTPASSQGVLPPMKTRAKKKGQIRPRPKEESEMEWETVTGNEEQNQEKIQMWGSMVVRAAEKDMEKNRKMITKMASHPQAMGLMTAVLTP